MKPLTFPMRSSVFRGASATPARVRWRCSPGGFSGALSVLSRRSHPPNHLIRSQPLELRLRPPLTARSVGDVRRRARIHRSRYSKGSGRARPYHRRVASTVRTRAEVLRRPVHSRDVRRCVSKDWSRLRLAEQATWQIGKFPTCCLHPGSRVWLQGMSTSVPGPPPISRVRPIDR